MATNSKLITTASTVDVEANGTNDTIANTDGATAFVLENGNLGDDTIQNFGKNDSILTKVKLYDGNGDGIIDFGKNGVLDVDRVGNKAGDDQLTLQGLESNALRYLGTKEGYYVYADASVRLEGFKEGTVGDDTFNAGKGAFKFFYDNALGLNLGKDTINNFGNDDLIVSTKELFNSNKDVPITFGANGLLDISGQNGPEKSDPKLNPGGQLDIKGTDGNSVGSVHLVDHKVVAGVDYYYYGLAGYHDATLS